MYNYIDNKKIKSIAKFKEDVDFLVGDFWELNNKPSRFINTIINFIKKYGINDECNKETINKLLMIYFSKSGSVFTRRMPKYMKEYVKKHRKDYEERIKIN